MTYKTPCQLGDPEVWFPLDEDGRAARPAREGCRACLGRTACLTLALELGAEGIWGGTSTSERRAMRRAARRQARTA
jgi:WhiB family redox-sensing transcriptional regulator